MVPIWDLFYFSDGLDWVCMVLGTIAGIGTGASRENLRCARRNPRWGEKEGGATL